MATQVTPSKQVRDVTTVASRQTRRQKHFPLTRVLPQAASSLENLKMSDSPIKKLDFESVGKENASASFKPADALTDKVAEKPLEVTKAAPTAKELEAQEPLLQENPNRFVMFPIKYHEVSHVADASTRKVVRT